MTKTDFLKCVADRPDEHRVAAKYGVPTEIRPGPSRMTALGAGGPIGTIWLYGKDGSKGTFQFGDDGRLYHSSTPPARHF